MDRSELGAVAATIVVFAALSETIGFRQTGTREIRGAGIAQAIVYAVSDLIRSMANREVTLFRGAVAIRRL